MNESGYFSSDYIRNCRFNGWFSTRFTEPNSKDLNAYDYNKHYTSCLMGKGISFGWQLNLLMVILKLVLITLKLIITV